VSRWTAERWAASSGIGFAIVLVVSSFIAGTPPHYNASASKIGAYLHDHHKALTIQSALSGVAVILFLWFLASFAGTFREAGQRRLSTIMYGAGVAGVTLAAVGDAMQIAIVRLNVIDGGGAASAFYAVSVFFYVKLFWPMAALALATALATQRSRALPQWYCGLSVVGAVLFVLGGLSMRQHGFFSPAGAMVWIGFLGFAVWILISSVLLVQKTDATPAAATSTAPA
jgi:hypothetical protein